MYICLINLLTDHAGTDKFYSTAKTDPSTVSHILYIPYGLLFVIGSAADICRNSSRALKSLRKAPVYVFPLLLKLYNIKSGGVFTAA